MKKILIVIVVLIALVALAAGILVATFDPNRFRPLIEQKVREATGYDLKIGGIGLAFRGGLALAVNDVRLSAGDAEPFVRVRSVVAAVDVASVLARSPRVTSIRIEQPLLLIERRSDGRYNYETTAAPVASAPSPATTAQAGGAALAIDSVVIENGRIEYLDGAQKQQRKLELSDLDLSINDIAPGKPLRFDGSAALLGRSQNVRVTGQVVLPAGATPVQISGVTLETDLEKIDYDKAIAAVPELREFVRAGWKGRLKAELSNFSPSPDAIKKLESKIQLQGGRLELSLAPLPVEDVLARISASQGRIRIEELAASFAGGRIGGVALADLTGPVPQVQFTLNALDLNVAQLLAAGVSREVMTGRLSGLFEGTASGTDAASLATSLIGGGRISLRDAVVLNFNLVREIVRKMSILPGASESIEKRLPPAYRQRLEQADTRLGPVDVPFTVAQGRVEMPQLAFGAQDFALRGSAVLHPGNILQARASVEVAPDLSQSIVGAVDAAKYFLNPRGAMELPATIEGPLGQLKVVPDLGQATQRFVADQGQKLLSDLLSKKSDAPAQDGAQQAAGGTAAEDPLQSLIKSFS